MPGRPLKGLRVVEYTVWLAGPSAGVILGDWGAEVIKLEEPGGDPARSFFAQSRRPPPYNWIHEAYNRNKRCLAIDLKKPQAREIAYRLVERADIFLTNRRPDALARRGLDYQSLSRINPQLIYAHNSGLGPRGPEKGKKSFDELGFWARSGIMSVLGEPDEPPPLQQTGLGDLNNGTHLAAGVLLGLLIRQQTGKGMEVNTSLLGSACWSAGWNLHEALATGRDSRRISRKKARNPLLNSYPTKDGWLYIEVSDEREWADFCRALGKEEWISDPRFNSPRSRVDNNVLLISLLDETLSQRPTEEWKARLGQYDLGWEAMQSLSQVIQDPQVQANEYLVEVPHPSIERLRVVATPIQLHRTPFRPSRVAPGLGEHTEEILRELGYSEEECKTLEWEKVVVQWQAKGK